MQTLEEGSTILGAGTGRTPGIPSHFGFLYPIVQLLPAGVKDFCLRYTSSLYGNLEAILKMVTASELTCEILRHEFTEKSQGVSPGFSKLPRQNGFPRKNFLSPARHPWQKGSLRATWRHPSKATRLFCFLQAME